MSNAINPFHSNGLSHKIDSISMELSILYFKGLLVNTAIKWASTLQNLSLGFPTKRDSKLSPQLQRPARTLKFHQ